MCWVKKDVIGHRAGKWTGTRARAEEQLQSQAEEGFEQRGAGLDKNRNPRGVRFMWEIDWRLGGQGGSWWLVQAGHDEA